MSAICFWFLIVYYVLFVLPAEVLGTSPCTPKTIRKIVRKVIMNRMKGKEQVCGENRLKVQ